MKKGLKTIFDYTRKYIRRVFIIDKFEKLDKELADTRAVKEVHIEKQNIEKAAEARWKERQLPTKIGWLKFARATLLLVITLALSILMNVIFPSAGKTSVPLTMKR